METVPPEYTDLFEKPSIATLCSLLPSGHPQVTPVWAGYDDEYVLVTTRKETQKYRNVTADSRVTVTVIDPDDIYRYVEIRGEVEKTPEDGALAFSDTQAQRYWGTDEFPFAREAPRALLHIRPRRVVAPDVRTPDTTHSGQNR